MTCLCCLLRANVVVEDMKWMCYARSAVERYASWRSCTASTLLLENTWVFRISCALLFPNEGSTRTTERPNTRGVLLARQLKPRDQTWLADLGHLRSVVNGLLTLWLMERPTEKSKIRLWTSHRSGCSSSLNGWTWPLACRSTLVLLRSLFNSYLSILSSLSLVSVSLFLLLLWSFFLHQ